MSIGPEMFVSRAEIHDASSQKSSDRETVAVPRPRVRIIRLPPLLLLRTHLKPLRICGFISFTARDEWQTRVTCSAPWENLPELVAIQPQVWHVGAAVKTVKCFQKGREQSELSGYLVYIECFCKKKSSPAMKKSLLFHLRVFVQSFTGKPA